MVVAGRLGDDGLEITVHCLRVRSQSFFSSGMPILPLDSKKILGPGCTPNHPFVNSTTDPITAVARYPVRYRHGSFLVRPSCRPEPSQSHTTSGTAGVC